MAGAEMCVRLAEERRPGPLLGLGAAGDAARGRAAAHVPVAHGAEALIRFVLFMYALDHVMYESRLGHASHGAGPTATQARPFGGNVGH